MLEATLNIVKSIYKSVFVLNFLSLDFVSVKLKTSKITFDFTDFLSD